MGVTLGCKVYGDLLEFSLPHVTNGPPAPGTGKSIGLFLTSEQVHCGLALPCSARPSLWKQTGRVPARFGTLHSSGRQKELVDCTLVMNTNAQKAHTLLLITFPWPKQVTPPRKCNPTICQEKGREIFRWGQN